MKTLIHMIHLMLLLSAPTYAADGGGTVIGGGGDPIEIRYDEIRLDILKWIQKGGGQDLDFVTENSSGITYHEYRDRMSSVLRKQKVTFSFVEANNSKEEEETTLVDGKQKVCRGFDSKRDQKLNIICLRAPFMNLNASDQYILIHHEFAGLAGIERNVGAASDYFLSRQITDYLAPQTVLKLAIKKREPVASNPITTNASRVWNDDWNFGGRFILESAQTKGQPSSIEMGGEAVVLFAREVNGITHFELGGTFGRVGDQWTGSFHNRISPKTEGRNGLSVLAGIMNLRATQRSLVMDVVSVGGTLTAGPVRVDATASPFHFTCNRTSNEGFCTNESGVALSANWKVNRFLSSFVGGSAYVIWGGGHPSTTKSSTESQSDGPQTTTIILVKPGATTDGLGTFLKLEAGITLTPFENLEIRLAGEVESQDYQYFETGFDDKRVGPNKNGGFHDVRGMLQVNWTF